MHASAGTLVSAETRPAISIVSEFPLEWAAIAAIALLDLAWIRQTKLSFHIPFRDLAAVIAVFLVGVSFRTLYRDRRGSLIAEYCALSLVTTAIFGILSYLCCAAALPLIDSELLHLDQMFGFDWNNWFQFVRHYSFMRIGLYLLYASISVQDLYFLVLFGLLGDVWRLREVYWIFFVSCAVTLAFSAIMPALGHVEAFARGGEFCSYLTDVTRLRHGGNLHFDVASLEGIVTFPSFHTSLAIMLIYAFRRTGFIGIAVAGINLLMLPAIPPIGCHYLVDMLAGAAVALGSIMLVRSCLGAAR